MVLMVVLLLALLILLSIDRRVCSVLPLLLVLSSCSLRCRCSSCSVCPWRRVWRLGYCPCFCRAATASSARRAFDVGRGTGALVLALAFRRAAAAPPRAVGRRGLGARRRVALFFLLLRCGHV